MITKNLTSMTIRTASDANEDSRKRFVTDARQDGCSKRWSGTNGKARMTMKLIDADKLMERLIANISLTNAIDRSFKEVQTVKTKEIKYYDEDEQVWKIGRVIVDE